MSVCRVMSVCVDLEDPPSELPGPNTNTLTTRGRLVPNVAVLALCVVCVQLARWPGSDRAKLLSTTHTQ